MHHIWGVHKIQAAVLRASGGPLKIESLEIEGPRDDEVLVRIVSSGICRTDIDFMDDWDGDPVVLGHEGAGVVEVVGKNVKGARPGDHVVLSYQSCGSCAECRKGHPAGCERFYDLNFGFARMDGSNAYEVSGARGHFFGQSSFATHALATGRNLVKVSKDLDLPLLAPLGCGLQTGAGTVMNSLKVPKGASIAVFGTGSVGLAAIMAASIVGAGPIIAIDKNPRRLDLALELGATHAIDSRTGYPLQPRPYCRPRCRLRPGDHGRQHDAQARRCGSEAERHCGTHCRTGQSESLPGGRKVIGVIQGDAVPQRFIPKLIGLYRAGRFPFDRLVRFYDFKDINEAVADSRKGDTIKPVLRIGEGVTMQ